MALAPERRCRRTGLTVTVVPPGVSATGGVTPITDTVVITDAVTMQTINVSLTVTPLGAVIEWFPIQSPVALSFVSQGEHQNHAAATDRERR